jgi:hypothetical protein
VSGSCENDNEISRFMKGWIFLSQMNDLLAFQELFQEIVLKKAGLVSTLDILKSSSSPSPAKYALLSHGFP